MRCHLISNSAVCGLLLQGLLDFVFAEVALACRVGGPDGSGVERFRHGNEAHVGGIAPRGAGGRRDALANGRQIRRDLLHRSPRYLIWASIVFAISAY